MIDVNQLVSEARTRHAAKFGNGNTFPPNWKPCSADDFWGLFMTYAPEIYEFRQMMYPEAMLRTMPKDSYGKVTAQGAKLFFYSDGTGLAMVANYNHKRMEHRTPLLYKFAACVHDMHMVPAESHMCYTVSKCSKCGYKHAVDSSD